MIELANRKDYPELVTVWQAGFDDDEQTVLSFLNGTETFCSHLCYRTDERIVSALHVIDCRFGNRENSEKAGYLYALATLDEYRGRGIMGELINEAFLRLQKSGCKYAFIVPAEKSLVGYYERFGFLPLCEAKVADIPAETVLDIPIETRRLSTDGIKAAREKNRDNIVLFDRGYIGFATEFCDMKAIEFDGGYAIYELLEKTVRIIEYGGEINKTLSAVKFSLNGESQDTAGINTLMSAADSAQNPDTFRVIMPEKTLFGETVCRGMIKALGGAELPKSAHIGLIMD